ncbi:MAG: AMP-binding protein, partial [bacterium]|nr:AMP-binding protein [bacterium]
VIGTPVVGRRHEDLSGIIGMFVNTLAVRNYPEGEKNLESFIKEVKENAAKAFENQEYPFEGLLEKIALKGRVGRNPLFDVMFTHQDMGIPRIEIPGLKMEPYPYASNISKFDITFICEEAEGELLFTLEYSTELFKKDSLLRIVSYFKTLITGGLEKPEQKILQVEVIPGEEKRRILFDFNEKASGYPTHKTIHGLFEEQVAKTPDNTCVVDAGRSVTFRELNEIANRLAAHLRSQGVNELVGLLAAPSLEMITGILGILKTGCGYVPLNPKAPEERNIYMLDECLTDILLTVGAMNQSVEKIRTTRKIIYLDHFDKDVSADGHPEYTTPHQENAIAYVVFTSGSTGKPKGVPIVHSNLSPLLHWGYKELGIAPKDRTLQNLSYYFDWSVWEIFITLTTGASLYTVPGEQQMNPETITAFMAKNKITIFHATPTQWGYLVPQRNAHLREGKETWEQKGLRYLFIGAEKLTLDLVERSIAAIDEECRIFNMY